MKHKIFYNILEIITGISILFLEITLLPHTCCDMSTQHLEIIIAIGVLTLFRVGDLICNIIRSKNETKNK